MEERHGDNFACTRSTSTRNSQGGDDAWFDRLYEHGEGCYSTTTRTIVLDMLSDSGVRTGPVPSGIKTPCAKHSTRICPAWSRWTVPLADSWRAADYPQSKQIERLFFCNSGAEAVEASISSPARARDVDESSITRTRITASRWVRSPSTARPTFVKASDRCWPTPPRSPSATSGADSRAQARRVAAFIVEPIQGRVSTN